MLAYNDAFNLHCELNLNSGRSVRLDALQQSLTYGGLIEGIPSARVNDLKVETTLQNTGENALLIRPVRRNYLRTPGDMDDVKAFGGAAAEWLPIVTCVACFSHTRPARDLSKDCSVLKVVWFQNEFAMPIDEGVLEQLRSVDWEKAAEDVEL